MGSDINRYSLESIKILVEELFGGLDNVFLKSGNAADSLEMDAVLQFTPEVVIVGANRFFSILDPRTFSSVVEGFSKQIQRRGYLVAGISVYSDRNQQELDFLYHCNQKEYQVEESELGVLVQKKHPFEAYMKKEGLSEGQLVDRICAATQLPVSQVDISKAVEQVFYHPKHFREKLMEHGFEQESSRFVNQSGHFDREVVLFKKS